MNYFRGQMSKYQILFLICISQLFSLCAHTVNIRAENSTIPVMTKAGGYKVQTAYRLDELEKKYPTIQYKNIFGGKQNIESEQVRLTKSLEGYNEASGTFFIVYDGGEYHGTSSKIDIVSSMTGAIPVGGSVKFGCYHSYLVFFGIDKCFIELEEIELEGDVK